MLKNLTVLASCTAAILIGGVGSWVGYEKRLAKTERLKQCQELEPHWARNVHLISEQMREMLPPKTEEVFYNSSAANRYDIDNYKIELQKAVQVVSAIDRKTAKNVPHLDLYLEIRDRMRERFYVFANYKTGLGGPAHPEDFRQSIAEMQAIQIGAELCRTSI